MHSQQRTSWSSLGLIRHRELSAFLLEPCTAFGPGMHAQVRLHAEQLEQRERWVQDAAFCERLFVTGVGWLTAEPPSVTAACMHHCLTELLMHLVAQCPRCALTV